MVRTAIVYASTHQGNTYRLVKAISRKYHVTAIDATQESSVDLSEYDMIGFASGIDFGKFYAPVERFLRENLPQNKRVFFLYTCARRKDSFTRTVKTEALRKGAVILGEYGCKGYNTYGPWKLIGGMNKCHPTEEEVNGAIHFFEELLRER